MLIWEQQSPCTPHNPQSPCQAWQSPSPSLQQQWGRLSPLPTQELRALAAFLVLFFQP